MKFLLINLAVNTQDNSFHRLGIDRKFRLIVDFIEDFNTHFAEEMNDPSDRRLIKAILVAPEYFFARCCPETRARGGRHYEYLDYLYIRKRLTILSKQYPTILFVPGTIAWKSPLVKGTINPSLDWTPGNFAPVPAWEKREFNSASKYYRHMCSIGEVDTNNIVTRSWADYTREAPDRDLLEARALLDSRFSRFSGGRVLSWEDKRSLLNQIINTGLNPENYIVNLANVTLANWSFARNTAFFYLNGKKVGEYTKHSDYQETVSQSGKQLEAILPEEMALAINDDGPSILNICGLKIGVEICLDHACNILPRYLSTTSMPNIYSTRILPDIHLILSATVRNKLPILGIPIRIHSSTPESGNTELPNTGEVRRIKSIQIAPNCTAYSEVVTVDHPDLPANAVPMAKTDAMTLFGMRDTKHVPTTATTMSAATSATRNTLSSHSAGFFPAMGPTAPATRREKAAPPPATYSAAAAASAATNSDARHTMLPLAGYGPVMRPVSTPSPEPPYYDGNNYGAGSYPAMMGPMPATRGARATPLLLHAAAAAATAATNSGTRHTTFPLAGYGPVMRPAAPATRREKVAPPPAATYSAAAAAASGTRNTNISFDDGLHPYATAGSASYNRLRY